MPAVETSYSCCSCPGTGSGSSTTSRTSGPPKRVISSARMVATSGETRGCLARSGGADDLDGAARPGGTGQPFVCGQQRNVERLGECDVGGVVESHVLSELPAPGQQGY